MITDPSIVRVDDDLRDGALLSGCALGRWRVISYEHPTLYFAISATEPDGKQSEYAFKADLCNFPAQAPKVQIWNLDTGESLAQELRPKGGRRVQETFKKWGEDTVYRPWDRLTGPHNNNTARYPHLAWRPERRLAFLFEDLHGILNSNARAKRVRLSA